MMLLAGIDAATEAALRAALPDVHVGLLHDSTPTREELRAAQAMLAVVEVGADPDASFQLVTTLSAAGVRVITVGPKDADVILRAMREGAREYLTAGDTERLVRAIREQIRPPRIPGLGTVVAVMATKGGGGATTVATNLAGVIARHGERVCLLDVDFVMGDVLSFLDLSGGSSISDLIANLRRVDRDLLDSSLAHHPSGVHVLAQTEKVTDAPSIEPSGLTSLIQCLRQHYKAIIVDGLRTFDDHGVAVLDASDHVLLVVAQDVPGVRRAQRCVSFLRRLGVDDARIPIVVNRYSKRSEVKRDLISETIGISVSATIANDYPAVMRAINQGKLVQESSPGSPVTRDIQALDSLVGLQPGTQQKPSLLRRLFLERAPGNAS